MTDYERLQGRKAELERELKDIQNELHLHEPVSLEEYIQAIENKSYFLNLQGAVVWSSEKKFNPYLMFPFYNYPTEDLAHQARQLKGIDDKLLAFKYCYDRDYKPDFDFTDVKYFIVYSHIEGRFEVARSQSLEINTVYFSSEVIAQKCCDWLNNKEENKQEENE